jgi:hypothetical protein
LAFLLFSPAHAASSRFFLLLSLLIASSRFTQRSLQPCKFRTGVGALLTSQVLTVRLLKPDNHLTRSQVVVRARNSIQIGLVLQGVCLSNSADSRFETNAG